MACFCCDCPRPAVCFRVTCNRMAAVPVSYLVCSGCIEVMLSFSVQLFGVDAVDVRQAYPAWVNWRLEGF
jgi:hypothetical protein